MVDIAALLNTASQAKPGEAVIPQAVSTSGEIPAITGFSELLSLLASALPANPGAAASLPVEAPATAKPASLAGAPLPEDGKILPVALPVTLPLAELSPAAEPAKAEFAEVTAEETTDAYLPQPLALPALALVLPLPVITAKAQPSPAEAQPAPAAPQAAPIVVTVPPVLPGQPAPAATPVAQLQPLPVAPPTAAAQKASLALTEPAAATTQPQVRLRPVARAAERRGEPLPAPTGAAVAASDAPRPILAIAAADPLSSPVLAAAAPVNAQDNSPTPGTVTAAPRSEAPQDFAALVDRLVQAREMAAPAAVHAALSHAEFGQVSLRFEQDDSGLSVSMASADPAFARAAQAAIPAAQGEMNANTNARQDAPQGSASGFTAQTPTGQSSQQGRSGEQPRSAADQSIAGQPARRDDPSDDAPRGGIFA